MATPDQYITTFEGQPYEFLPKRRPVQIYTREPSKGTDSETGLMLLLHYWGGTFDMLFDACDEFCDRYNVVAISVNYLQSGTDDQEDIPYDLGVIQAIDCLRALYHTIERLKDEGKPFNPRRIFSAGQSGGGHLSHMCAKFAPHTFQCIFDLCGASGLTDHHAFDPGEGKWSQDPSSPFYRTAAHQEIRDIGNPTHLDALHKANPDLKFIIVHGLDDTSCSIHDKLRVFQNLITAGFRPSTLFVTPEEVDGTVINTKEHHLGVPRLIYEKFGDEFFKTDGIHAKRKETPTDFELKETVRLPVTGGVWTVDFSGIPTIDFKRIGSMCKHDSQ